MRRSLRTKEAQLYTDVWALPSYGTFSPGEQYVPLFLDMAQITPDTTFRYTVLDAGCGSGKGALALKAAGFAEVHCCDYTDEGLVPEARALPFHAVSLWDDLRVGVQYLPGRSVDYVYCCDVLEHIPTAFTMLVISRLLEVSRRGVFLSISTVPDQFGAWAGQPLHKTVQPFTWWRDQIHELGAVVEARDLLNAGVYLVQPC
jgi:2-polyprenyl-3-methyl-5-hydroxy-6-metoxy-1,4-benzoquinol methylase